MNQIIRVIQLVLQIGLALALVYCVAAGLKSELRVESLLGIPAAGAMVYVFHSLTMLRSARGANEPKRR